jgi:hypothetical protein
MTSYKAGLHKNISSIFDGAPLQRPSADSASKQTSLPNFVTEQTDSSMPGQDPQQHLSQQQSYPQPPKPVQKLYKDTAEKTHNLISKTNSQKGTSFSRIYQAFKAKLLPRKSGINQKRQISSLVLVPVLCLVLVFVIFKFVLPASPKKGSGPQIQTVLDEVLTPVKINWQIPQPISASLRDPMKPLILGQIGADGQTTSGQQYFGVAGITLAGIVYSEDNPAAIIGTQVMHTGEKIGDVSIVKIDRNTVTFERNGQTKILRVGQSWLPTGQM